MTFRTERRAPTQPTRPPSAAPDPAAKPRLGPRPLGLHLAVTLATLLSSPAGLLFLRNGWLRWNPQVRDRAARLRAEVAAVDHDLLAEAVDREMRRRLDAVLTGLERYRHHPYRRDLPDPPVIWAEGGSRLLDYGASLREASVPVLFVPSLINRHYILDLAAGRSLMRWLTAQGVRPFLMDWGRPGGLERGFTLTDYIAGRLERALEELVSRLGRPVPVVGYCMGGLLGLALALRRRRDVCGLGLLATPWDFHAADPAAARRLAASISPFLPALEAWGELPVDAIQTLFASVDPCLVLKKFSQFGRLDPDSDQARIFVALEDWVNDGVPLAAPVAHECLIGWYGENTPARGCWLVAGQAVDPQRVQVPTLVAVPERDRIVPPVSARSLAALIPQAQMVTPSLGHIGMVVGTEAERQLWQPLATWLRRFA